MQIEQIRIKNFRVFKDITIKNIPRFAVIVGSNGSGKTILFSIFGFLRQAMITNVTKALSSFGGFQEVRSRDTKGAIEIKIKFRPAPKKPLMTYDLHIIGENDRAIVKREVLTRSREHRKSLSLLDFSRGKGEVIVNEEESDESAIRSESYELKSPDILAIKSLAKLKRFPTIVDLGDLIERWHVYDFRNSRTQQKDQAHKVNYLHDNHPKVFNLIRKKLSERIPGIDKIEAKKIGRRGVNLSFGDKLFKTLFQAKVTSDGTIKMLAYLTMLYDPKPYPLLCVEEPDNQLYPSLLGELAEEFRAYADRGKQVFVSTHSPDFLNAVELGEVFWLQKESGYTTIKRAQENKQLKIYMQDGARMGHLWTEGFFKGADPQ